MLTFIIVLAVGVLATLGVQALDVEGLRQNPGPRVPEAAPGNPGLSNSGLGNSGPFATARRTAVRQDSPTRPVLA